MYIMEVEYNYKPNFCPNFCQDSHGNFVDVQPQIFQDAGGNFINVNGIFEVEPLVEYSKEDLENFGIELGKVLEKNTIACCKVCFKKMKNNKTDCHYKCKVVSNRLKKIKKELVNIEFELFCLRYTEGDAEIQVFNSLDNINA